MKKFLIFPITIIVSLSFGFLCGFLLTKDEFQITDSSFFSWTVFDEQCIITNVSDPDAYGEIVISAVLAEDTKLKYAFRIMPDTIYFEGGIPLDALIPGDIILVFASYSHMTTEREVICRYVELLPVVSSNDM